MTPPPTRKKPWRKWLTRLLVYGVFVVVLWLITSYAAVHRLTRRDKPVQAEPTPAIAWGSITPFRLTTDDGQELGAWFIDGRADRPVVLLLHGNAGSRSTNLSEAELAASAGNPVLLITFRAHGDSTGNVNDFGYSGRRDVLAAIAWLREHHPRRSVVVWGRSLGSAAALFAAEECGDTVNGYILECPYQDLRTATRNRTRLHLPIGVEYVAYQGLSTVSPAVLPNADDISPLNAARRLPPSARVLVLAGGADPLAKPEEATAIAEAIGERAELVIIQGAGHFQLAAVEPETYRRTLLAFLTKCSQPAE